MPLEFLISALVTLFVVVDPVGLVPAFLAVTEGLSEKQRREVALRASLIAAAILFGAAIGGDWLLRQLGISLPAFRIAGGLLLFAIAFEMVFDLRQARESKSAEDAVEEHVHHIAAFPLAIPLLAGPGAITAVILLTGQAAGRPVWLAFLFGVIAAVTLASFLCFCAAGRIARFMGITGNVVLSRLLGVILAALAVQYVVDGVRIAFGV
ncbi:MAG: MarC family protein [Pseudomonadota bacterium]